MAIHKCAIFDRLKIKDFFTTMALTGYCNEIKCIMILF
jgi:hypothetical protein